MGLQDWLDGLFGGGSNSDTGTARPTDDPETTSSGESAGRDDGGSGGSTDARGAEAAGRSRPAGQRGGGGDDGGEGAVPDDPEGAGPPTDGAELIVEQATSKGFDLDYSPDSLERVDELVEALPDEGLESAAPGFSGYLGEIFVRNYDGEWTFAEELGWVVDVPANEEDATPATLLVGHAVQTCFEGPASFAQVHDVTAAQVAPNARAVSDDPYPEDAPIPTRGRGPASDEAPEHLVEEYQKAAGELVDGWEEYDLEYTPASLEALDSIVAEVYDLEDEEDEADEEDEEEDASGDDVGTDGDDVGTDGDDAGADGDDAGADADGSDADDEADEDGDDETTVAERTATDDGPVVPEGPELRVTEGEEAAAFAGYVGEVFVRNYDAEWRSAGERPVLVVRGEAATAEIDPISLVESVFSGELSFTEVHEGVVADAGLETEA